MKKITYIHPVSKKILTDEVINETNLHFIVNRPAPQSTRPLEILKSLQIQNQKLILWKVFSIYLKFL